AGGGGGRGAGGWGGGSRRTSMTRSDGGLCWFTGIGPPGAATMHVTGCCATNAARAPAGDHSPNRVTARAASGSRPRAARIPTTSDAVTLPGAHAASGAAAAPAAPSAGAAAMARSTAAAPLGEALAAAGEDGQLAALPPLRVDDGDLVARVEFHRGDRAGVHPVTLQPRVGGQQAGKEQAGPAGGHLPGAGRGLAFR